ncbi:MAG TPA: hypothetical protein VHD76_16315 [Bryobacteraceae bacterium]|jgi:hypothetical protein|nr:hypothetical protein [Bryobacteraceae bacterium]
MAVPAYFTEKRYSYHVYNWQESFFNDYQTADPQTSFEKSVQDLYAKGYDYLKQEEYSLALDAFRQLQNLILTTVHPTLPLDSYRRPLFQFPIDVTMVDALAAKVGTELKALPVVRYSLPDAVVGKTPFPDPIEKKLTLMASSGLGISTQRAQMTDLVTQGLALAANSDWQGALDAYNKALAQAPPTDTAARASLTHDIAILTEKSGNAAVAARQAASAAKMFGDAKEFSAQVDALETLAGMQTRAGDTAGSTATIKQATDLVSTQRLFPVNIGTLSAAPVLKTTLSLSPVRVATGVFSRSPALSPAAVASPALDFIPPAAASAPALMGLKFTTAPATEKTFTISGAIQGASLSLAGDATANVKSYLQTVATSSDLSLVLAYGLSHVEIVAYLPSMYFFVLPMAIGDCLAGLGNYTAAEQQYRSTLVYPFINQKYEVVKLWTRLAGVYLELGDQAYRNAKDDAGQYPTARAFYERLIKSDGTLDPASPLYQDAKFAGMKTRVQNFIAAGLSPAFNDNPDVLSKVLEANVKLTQIKHGLNFFGFAPDYAPPFSFEYLQNTAKYFAEQASRIEQRYIQFKTAAETQTLQREQLDQQAEVASQTVVLEQRGLAETQAALATAQANLNYANVQKQNAVDSRNDFNNVKDELLELTELQDWANAAAVDKDDEVSITISGYSYYNSDHRRRSLVIQDLSHKKNQITNDLESARLDREVGAATAYAAVAQAQVADAQARVSIANQRVAIAQLQQKNAEENRDFMDLEEFSARLWYDLAKEAKRLSHRYLDMATEIAFLTERAYNAETERGLSVIRFDYRYTAAGNLLGADTLTADLDYFTLDLLTTTRSKKAPVKRVISLADAFPLAFHQLKTTGSCNFQTTLAMFDRQAPGMYLCKTRNVELVFVGVTNATLAGTLRNGGVSAFRRPDGSTITRVYPADVMPLSAYEFRQDALAFRVTPNELRLFENNGIETQWQIDLPPGANDFDYGDLLDAQLTLYYDGFFSPALEQTVKAALPAGGSATRAFSMQMTFPDELFFLKNQGQAEVAFEPSLYPRNQKDPKRTRVVVKVSGSAAAHLKLRITSQVHGAELVVATDANGVIPGAAAADPLGGLLGESGFDKWTILITAADNPALAPGGILNLNGIDDIMILFDYDFQFR